MWEQVPSRDFASLVGLMLLVAHMSYFSGNDGRNISCNVFQRCSRSGRTPNIQSDVTSIVERCA